MSLVSTLNKCETCLYASHIVSENGIHSVCSLCEDIAMNCILGKENHCVKRPGVDNELEHIRSKE